MDASNIILEIIKELRQDSSLNYKKDVLRKYSDYEPFQKFLVYAYNPRVNYFMKKIPTIISYGHGDHSITEMYSLLGQLKQRELTGNQAQEVVREYLLNANQVIRELFELVIGRDIRAGVGVGIINEVYKGLIEEIPYQRCSKLDEKIIARLDMRYDGWLAQKKLDGTFSYIIIQNGVATLLTRAGTQWTSDKLSEELKKVEDIVLVGEALVKDNGRELDRKTGNGLINSFIKREATLDKLSEKARTSKTTKSLKDLGDKRTEFEFTNKRLYFEVWDSLILQEFEAGISARPYTQRFGEAIRIAFSTKSINPVPSFKVYSLKEAEDIAKDYMEEGYEGAILKKSDSIWKDGTSKDMIKIKAVLDADLLCVDVEEGSGKYKGKVGALVLETSCGRLRVKVGTGLNDLDRDKPFDYYIGKVIEIQYNEFIKSKSKNTDSLFLPRFVEVREDKNTATSYEEIVA